MIQILADSSLAKNFEKFCRVAGTGEKKETSSGRVNYGKLELERVGSAPTERVPSENLHAASQPHTPSTPDGKPKRSHNTKQKSVAVSRLARLLETEPRPRVDDETKARLVESTAGTGFVYDEGTNTVQLTDKFRLLPEIFQRAYPYQRHAVQWMWQLFTRDDGIHGGILGDDMGLGKTFQVTAFLSGVFRGHPKTTAVVVVPVSLMATWQTEIEKWLPKTTLLVFHGSASKKRDRALDEIKETGGIVISTYGTLVTQIQSLQEGVRSKSHVWSIVVFDEANKIKNPAAQVSKVSDELSADMKLLLTGTPIQNNLDELWALFNVACQGKLLGEKKHFNLRFGTAITTAQDRHATEAQQEAGEVAMEQLRAAIDPFFLRREKATTLLPQTAGNGIVERAAGISVPSTLPLKAELIVWTRLSPSQLALYDGFLQTEEVRTVLNTTQSPLAALTVLKKICCHPLLLNERAREVTKSALLKGREELGFGEEDGLLDLGNETVSSLYSLSEAGLHSVLLQSGKLQCLFQLLGSFQNAGHRALVFSQSKVMLDIIQVLFTRKNISFERIDGDISDPSERQVIVNRFNVDSTIQVCLITTGVGAYGLTLTGADRVVIMDPSWNPAVDAQAVDRAYRIGQTRDVITYRMVTCGTIEEKIYRLQVFKGGLTESVMKAKHQHRYMTKKDLKQMFTLGDIKYPETKEIFASTLEVDIFLTNPDMRVEEATSISTEFDVMLKLMAKLDGAIAQVSRHDKLFGLKPKSADPAAAQGGKTPFAKKRWSMRPQHVQVSELDYEPSTVEDHTDEPCDSDSECEFIKVDDEVHSVPVTTAVRSRRARLIVDDSDADSLPGSPSPSKHLVFHDESDVVQDEVEAEVTASSPLSELRACTAHMDEVASFGFSCTMCRCRLDTASVQKYNQLLDEAHQIHKQARSRRDRAGIALALGLLMDAVQICSDDVRLHSTIVRTAKLV